MRPPIMPSACWTNTDTATSRFPLYLAFTSPHWPLHAHESDIQKYQGKYMIGWDELRCGGTGG